MLPDSLVGALKEWDVAVQALAVGETILLLRKGGIREVGSSFEVKHRQFLLYPTYEHQKPHLLKAKYARKVVSVNPGWHPETICIDSWAEITDVFAVGAIGTIEQLLSYHIWQPEFIRDRWQGKPNSPLYLLLLRAYKLPQPSVIPYHPSYGGCRSWIEILEPISLAGSLPVLSASEYQQQLSVISYQLSTSKNIL